MQVELVIDDGVRAALTSLRAHAESEENWHGQQTPGDDPKHGRRVGRYRVVYSIFQEPERDRLWRMLSVSIGTEHKPGTLPNPYFVEALGHELGFEGSVGEWQNRIEYSQGVAAAILVVQQWKREQDRRSVR